MGSKSDWEMMSQADQILTDFGVPHEARIVSAHRTPQWMAEYGSSGAARGHEGIIAGAGGQLGRMFAMAARRLGYRVHTLAPEDDTPTGQIADVEVNAAYDDIDAVRAFARAVDVVTFEFENVPAAAAAAAEEIAIVRPNGRALGIAQHRIREKTFLAEVGVPVAPFAPVRSDEELAAAAARVGFPAVLKTASFGYDGKGQVAVDSPDRIAAAWQSLERRDAILEAFIDLDREISVIGARGVAGEWSHFGPIENAHV